MIRVILDTNFLLMPAQFKIDIFRELTRVIFKDFELHIVEPTLRELDSLMKKGKGKNKRAAKMGNQLIDFASINVIKTKEKHVDKAIMNIVSKKDIVCTQDKQLKDFLIKKGVNVVIMKKKSHLQLIEA
ncbi:MAG: hypothetical protein MAG795_00410 [Candidatus Woesearchaeota archaeon]|nr:hypothetical protein [Candidatus Woesearchaeota archaeon]